MLVEFTVGNYRSFNKPVTLSMVAAKIKSKDKQLDADNVFEAGRRLRLLKSAAIYGANASGKTNLVKALSFMRSFVLTSSMDRIASEPIHGEEFRLDSSTLGEPSLFEVVFLMSGRRFRYGFEVIGDRVESEWLFWVPSSREARLFVREEDTFKVSKKFSEEPRLLERHTRKNALFLSVVAQFNGPVAMEILEWFGQMEVVSGLFDPPHRRRSYEYLKKDSYKKDVVDFVKRLDLGIADIRVKEIPFSEEDLPAEMPDEIKKLLGIPADAKRITINTLHQVRDFEGKAQGTVTFDLDRHESDGTKKIFSLAGLMVWVLKRGKVLVADELDARLHSLITSAILGMFHSPTTNPNNAQIIFTTHDTNLLDFDLLRRDQIWFIEKDELEASHLHSLVEYKVRNDASFEKDYMSGKYGAIPLVEDIGLFERDSDV